MGSAVISFSTNYLLKHTCTYLTAQERVSTRTGYEQQLFWKLAPAYFVNTCIVPFLSYGIKARRKGYFAGDHFAVSVNQDWYESGGLIGYVAVSLVAGILPELSSALRPKAWFNRYVRARFYTSQPMKNKLWKP